MRQWLDRVNILIGGWLLLSAWVLGFADLYHAAAWDAWVLGAAIFIVGLAAATRPALREEAVTLALGLLALISPWVLSFAHDPVATSNAVAVGVLVAAIAAWSMLLDGTIWGTLRERFDRRSSPR